MAFIGLHHFEKVGIETGIRLSSEKRKDQEKKNEQEMNAIIEGKGTALGALFPKLFNAGWTILKVAAASVVLFVVLIFALIMKVSREIFISTYPR